MNLFDRIKYKLSTSIKFVALLSLIFQLITLCLLFFNVFEAIVFVFIFYLFLIFIGISRYIELKSKSFKEVVFNLFYLINCFPFALFLLSTILLLWANMNTFPSKEQINPDNINYIIIDSNGNEIEKNVRNMKFDIKNKKFEDSIVRVKVSE